MKSVKLKSQFFGKTELYSSNSSTCIINFRDEQVFFKNKTTIKKKKTLVRLQRKKRNYQCQE